MKNQYDGLKAMKIQLADNDVIATSGTNCTAMIQLKMVDGVCITDPDFQQIEYVGDQG